MMSQKQSVEGGGPWEEPSGRREETTNMSIHSQPKIQNKSPQTSSDTNTPQKILTQTEVINLKLMIDNKQKRILYAEADNKFVDFLFSILSLPIGTVLKLLSTAPSSPTIVTPMIGSLSSLYRSANSMKTNYFESNRKKESLLNPHLPSKLKYLLGSSSSASEPKYFTCSSCPDSFSNGYFARCTKCSEIMTTEALYVHYDLGDGYVVGAGGMVTYMVMDDLTVKPITSSMSTISMLTQLNVEDIRHIEEKVIPFHLSNEGVELLRASLDSNKVLTDMFYYKLDLSTKPGIAVTTLDEDSDADKSPAPFAKRAKIVNLAATSSVNGNPKEKQVEIEHKEEERLSPPPKVLVDAKNRRGKDSTLKKLRLKKQESAFVALSTKNFPREAKESAKVDVGNTSKDSLKPDLDVQTSLYSKERAKVVRIVVSVRNSDKEELRKCRMLVDYKFEQLFQMYAIKLKVDLKSLVFVFDGDKIGPDDTPGGLGMEDDDMIEVHIKSS